MWGRECVGAGQVKARPIPCPLDIQCSMACVDRSTRVMLRYAARLSTQSAPFS